jgi:hypothetical protein
MAVTLGTIITDIRNRADLTNSQFITDEELTNYINYSLGELQGLIVNTFGGDYFGTIFTATVPAGGTFMSGSIPEDCYKILGVDLFLGGIPQDLNSEEFNNKITLQPFNFNERNRAASLNLQGYATQYTTNYRYRVIGNRVIIQPPASGDVNLGVYYVPSAPQFYTTDPLDLAQTFEQQNNLMNWLEYVIVDVCLKCKEKEETDASLFVRQKALLTERIRNEAANRDQGSPAQVSDVYAQGVVTDIGWNIGWGGTDWTY